MKTISIITNKKVDKTFNGVECLLKRSITKFVKINGIRRYTILTERCNYEEQEVLNEATNETTSEIVLVSLGIKDAETQKNVSEETADNLYNLIKNKVTLGASYNDFVASIEQQSLLIGTQQDKPYGTLPIDWEILNE